MVTAAASRLYALTPTVLCFFFSWDGCRAPRKIEEMEALPAATGGGICQNCGDDLRCRSEYITAPQRLSKASRR